MVYCVDIMSWTEVELEHAIQELVALGYVEREPGGPRVGITPLGLIKGKELLNRFPMSDRLLLMLTGVDLANYLEEKD